MRKGESVSLLEAMKMMSGIQTPCDRVIEEVLPQAGAPVSFGEALTRYREAQEDIQKDPHRQLAGNRSASPAGLLGAGYPSGTPFASPHPQKISSVCLLRDLYQQLAYPKNDKPHRKLVVFWRRRPDSNRGWRFCRPLPYHLATSPYPLVKQIREHPLSAFR